MHAFSPLLPSNDDEKSSSPSSSPIEAHAPTFPLRIKLNTADYTINVNQSVTVANLKQWVLDCHDSSSNGNSGGDTYLRLIVRGRLMAPDTATLDTFNVTSSDVVHAVLAKEGRGAQARMLRRLNRPSVHPGRRSNGNGFPDSSDSLNRLWRRIGIDASGVVVRREDDDSEESDEEDVEGGRVRQERRGFDRLRATGMTRDEVNIIRSYFSRSVDRYIERRRILIRASSTLRNNLASTDGRDRLESGDSHNSFLDNGSGEETDEREVDTGSGGDGRFNADVESGNANAVSNAEENSGNSADGEYILLDRLRMEDEWMSTQGPYSEFRMNLNTRDPLLLAAISGNNLNNPILSTMLSGTGGRRRGLFSRRTNRSGDGDSEEDEDDLMLGSLGPNNMMLPNGNTSAFRPFMSPLPSAGTDKDFFWGFILGFFVGFIMLFWVWMPTVPHKQKIGIISGVICQLGLSLLNKSDAGDVTI